MAKLTKAKARKRLLEAEAKFKKVYMAYTGAYPTEMRHHGRVVTTGDMEAVSKIVLRCLKRIQ